MRSGRLAASRFQKGEGGPSKTRTMDHGPWTMDQHGSPARCHRLNHGPRVRYGCALDLKSEIFVVLLGYSVKYLAGHFSCKNDHWSSAMRLTYKSIWLVKKIVHNRL